MKLKIILISFLLLACATSIKAEPVGPLISVTPKEFLSLPEGAQAIYTAGILDGMTVITYGYSIQDHDKFVRCARTLTLGNLAAKTVEWIEKNPLFSEGAGTAVIKSLGAYCKQKELR